MSSNEEDYNDGDSSVQSKKRRIQRACDICRRKKIRCDGVQMPGNRCSNCIAYSFDCTYVEAAKKRGPPKGYVEGLENRLEKLERLLRRLCPDGDFMKELERTMDKDPRSAQRAVAANPAPPDLSMERVLTYSPEKLRDITTSIIRGVGTPPVPSDELVDDDFGHVILTDNLKRLSMDPTEYRFFGKSSGAMLIQTAMELKNEYEGTDHDLRRAVLGAKRPEFWAIRPWERSTDQAASPAYVFPDDDLITSLTNLYFDNINIYLPLLHRPTFEKSIADGLHTTHDAFGATVLLVCAVGSRYSDDPRILLDGVDSYHSCGWRWFAQVQVVKKGLLAPPTLYDLQFYCLSVQFLQGSSAPQACWTMVGIGIRLSQDVGAHRRKKRDNTVTAEEEMWKRAFWVLVCLDRMVSSALGRPCAIQDEDFDLDLPVECDDEYWDHLDPEQRFKQPPNTPSVITAFNLHLKLNQVLAISLRTIYSINKSKILLGFVGQQWEQHIVAELDSALNKWVDSVPDYLRWDPNREDTKFFDQSVSLYASYYHIQILIHRPFIPSPRKPSPLSFPSLAICTNAARSCSHIVDIHRRRSKAAPPQIQIAVFTAGIVLLLNIWGGKRSGLTTDPKKEMADVHKCMQVLRASEDRWHSAGRLWDILYELASVGELPLPQPSPPTTNKRERNAESPISGTPAESSPSSSGFADAPRNIAGSRRILTKDGGGSMSTMPMQQMQQSQAQPLPSQHLPPEQQQQQQQASSSSSSQLFTLPVYSDELGRLPLHGQVRFSAQGLADADYWYPPNPSGPVPSSSSSSHAPSHIPGGLFPEMAPMPSAFMSPQFYDQIAPDFTATPYAEPPNAFPYRSGGVNIQAMNEVDPRQQQQQQQQHMMPPPSALAMQDVIDSDTIAMWSTAPTGFELDDWGTYLTSVSELTQGHHAGPSGSG